jgi:hypothetical protein
MAENSTLSRPGFYWDLDECAWVRCAAPVSVPEQPQTGVEDEAEVDVRSG